MNVYLCFVQSEIVSLTKLCGLSQRKIHTWFRHRRRQARPSNTKKFCEAWWVLPVHRFVCVFFFVPSLTVENKIKHTRSLKCRLLTVSFCAAGVSSSTLRRSLRDSAPWLTWVLALSFIAPSSKWIIHTWRLSLGSSASGWILNESVGFCLIFQTPWFWDTRECWAGYPKQVSLNIYF